MNRIFKVVWSRVKHCYVVTSEIARTTGRSKSSSVGRTAKAAMICAFVLSLQGGYASADGMVNGQQLIIDELQVTTGGEKNILIDGDRNNNPSVINHFVGADGKNLNVDNIVIGNHNTIERNNPKSTGSPVFSSVVIGSDNTMSGQHSLVIGEESSATDVATIALGYKANATGSNALAFGQNAKSQSTMTVALGSGANVEGPMGLGIGADSKVGANTQGGTAIGYNAEVDANVTGGVAIGYNAKSRVNNSTAIGHNAITRSEQGVAIGYNSWANRDAGVVGYDPLTNATYTTTDGSAVTSTWSGSYGAASIGKTYGTTTQTRQLMNVAAGSQDTDAVNVAQLKSLRNYVDTKTNIEEPNTYFHVNDGTNTGTGNATTNYGKISDAAGATATGAVTAGINAKGQGLTSVAIGQDSHAVTNESIAIGHNAVAGREDMPGITDPNDRTKVGKNSNIAIGNGAQATGGRNISIGEFAGKDVPDNWNIHNVNIGSEAGTASKKDYSVAIGYQAGALTDAAVQAAQAGVADGNRAPSVLLGKEAGKNTASYGNIAFGTGAASNIIDTRASQTIAIGNGAGQGMRSNDGVNLTYRGFGSGANIAIGAAAGQNLSGDGTVAIGNLAGRNSKGDNNILMGHLAGESANSDRSIIMGPESGKGANVTNDRAVLIGNFANGAIGTETLSTRNVIGIGSSVIATGNESIAVGRLARARATNAVAIGTKANVNGTNSVAVGNDISVTTDNSVVLGASSSGSETATKETTGTITGKGAVITYGDYIGAPPTDANGNLQTGYYVSVGKSGAERQIKHVAAGKVSQDSTDAINGSQLYATNQVVGNVAGSVTNILGGNATLGKDGNITMTNIGDTGENTIHDAIKKVSKEPNIYFHVNDGTNTSTGNAATNYGKISDAAGATHDNSIAAGVNAQAHSAGSIAVGANTVATNALSNDANRGSVVIGNNAVVAGGMVNGEQYGNSSVAIGANALAGRVIENGVVSETSAKYATNTGGLTAANANKNGSVMYLSGLLGDRQKTNDATAVGKDSRAVGDQAVAIGAQTVAGHASVAIGGNDLETLASDTANVTAYKTITGVDLAANIQADGVYPTTSAMKGSVAIGQKATSRTLMGTALGTTASVFEGGTLGTAIGTGARVGATDGSGSAQGGLAAGAGAAVEGDYSTALGNRSSVTGTESAAVGYKNTIAGNSSVALGSNINVTTDNSVVLGANSDGSANATTEIEGKITTTNGNEVVFGTYVGAPVDGGHYVSVGAKDAERQIKHVAAGKVSADSTDAINGSQLYATNKVVAELVDNSMSSFNVKSTATDGKIATDSATAAQTIKNGKTVEMQAGKNLTIKQTNTTDGNVQVEYSLADNIQVGQKGEPGKDGVDGKIGVNGKDGSAVVINGKDGSIGLNGKDGANGLTIKGDKGEPGVNGGDGITRIVYERQQPDPTDPSKTITVKEEVATLNDGLKFGGDMGNVQAVKLNKQVDVKGGITDVTKLATGDNIGVTAVAGTNGNAVLNVQLAKDITGLNSVTTNEVRLGDTNNYTTVKKDGDRITYTTPDGNGGTTVNKIANLSDEIHITDTTYTVGDKTKRTNAKDDEITLTYTDGNGQEVANKFAIIQGVAKSDLSNITNEGAKNITKLGTIVKAGDNVTVSESKDQTTGQITYTVNAKAQDLGKALLTYKANGSNSQTVTLEQGLNFKDGNYTTASVGADGVVKYDVTLGDAPTIKDGKAGVPGKDGNPGKDGIATIGEVVNIVNNTGWKANAKGNITGITPIATVVKPGDTVNYAAGSNLVVSQTLGTNEQTYTFSLSDNIKAGKDGKDGKDGSIGATGKDGNSVVLNGKDGSIGLTGKDGRDGVNGRDGASIDITTAKGEQVLVNRDPNHAGDTDQAERIVYMPKDKDGNYIKGEDGKNIVREVATMDDGLIFTGNNKTLNKHELNSTVKIIGERTDNKTSYTAAESAANNLIVEADGKSTLTVKMAKDLINLNSVTAGTAKLGNQTTTTVGGKDGGTGSFVTGLDNKTWNINNPDIVSGRAATEDQLKVVSDVIKTTETDIINKGFGLTADDSNSAKEKLGNTISVVGKETTGSDGTGHKNITTSVENNEVKIALNKDLDLGKDGSVTTGDTTINNDGVTINDGKGNVTTVNKGGLTITNKDGDRVTVDGSGLTIENGPSVTKDGIDAGNKQITNQASGASGKDANGNPIYNIDTNGANIGDVKQIAKNTAEDVVNKSGWTANATGNVVGSATATKVTPNTTVNFDAGDNLEITQTVNGNTQTYSYRLKDDLVLGGKDGKNGVDGSIGINGKDGSAVVINGKDGSIGLNGKDGANGLTIKGGQGPAGVNGKDGETITRIEYERTNPDGSKTTEQVATLNDGLKFTGNNTDTVNKHQLNTLVKVQGEGVSPAQSANFQSAAGNINVVANGSDTLEVRLNKDLTNISSISNTTNGPKISFGDNSVNITNGDLNMGGNKITNVAPGKDKTDVATVGQMTQVTSKDESVLVSESTNADGAKVYDLSVQSVDGRVARELSAEIGRVGAQGAALAALKPIQYDPLEPTQIMAGYGNYRGNSALALGVAHYKNESTMIHGGVSWAAGDGNHMMANAGITWKVGSRDSEAAIADRYRKGPISSAYALQNEMAAMKAENTGLKGEVAGLKAQNDQIIAENAEMKAENQEMKAQIAMLMQRLGL